MNGKQMFPCGSQPRLLLLLCYIIFQYLMELQSLVDASTLSHNDVKQIIKEFLTVTQHIDSIFGIVWPFNYLSCTCCDIECILGIVPSVTIKYMIGTIKHCFSRHMYPHLNEITECLTETNRSQYRHFFLVLYWF